MKKSPIIYIYSNGKAAAINGKDGSIVWEVSLKKIAGSSTMGAIGQISIVGDSILIGVNGKLICLSVKDGSLIWKNDLKGWGYSFVSIANNYDASMAAALQQQAATTTAVAAAT